MPDAPKPKRKGTPATRHGNGVGQGPGWGGPAKGPQTRGDREMFQSGNSGAYPPNMSRRERVAALEDKLFDLALNADRQETQVAAAAKLHAIYDGAPVQKNINLNVDDVGALGAAAIRDEIAGIEAALAGAEAPAVSGSVPPRPKDVVH